MSHQELEQYLASEAAQGLFLEEGEFYIVPEKALEKLSRFALPEPGFWVLKMVQAAVSAGAPSIGFTFLRRKVEVRFQNSAGWEAAAILRETLSGRVCADTPLRHLIAGLLGAAMGFHQEVTWRCGEHQVRVTRRGVETSANTEATDEVLITATRPQRRPNKADLQLSPVRYLLRQTADEFKALVDHTRVCPIPLKVDGYHLPRSYQVKVDDLPKAPEYDSEKPSGRQVLLAQAPLWGIRRPPLPYPLDTEPMTAEIDEELPSLRLAPQEGEPEGVICLYSCLQREPRLNFVQDGVLLESRPLYTEESFWFLTEILHAGEESMVIDLYLSVSWNDLDLSGFKVRTPCMSPIVEGVRRSLRHSLEVLRAHCFLPWSFSSTPTAPEQTPWNPTVNDLFGTALASLFIPHLLVVGGLLVSGYVVVKPLHAALQASPLWPIWEERRERIRAQKVERLIDHLDGMIERLDRHEQPAAAANEAAAE